MFGFEIMETNLKKIERTSKLKTNENWEFRAFIKGYDIPLEEIDSIIHELFDYVSSEIDRKSQKKGSEKRSEAASAANLLLHQGWLTALLSELTFNRSLWVI